jgi:hypothetical protein
MRILPLLLVALIPWTGADPAPSSVEPLSWLSGCWQMHRGASLIEEQWLHPAAGMLLGTGRTIRGGRVTEYEFVVLRYTATGATYEAHPSGQDTATFTAASPPSSDQIVFENLAHDFPQRVGYRRIGRDSLVAWIEGPAGDTIRRIEFPYTRSRCEAE